MLNDTTISFPLNIDKHKLTKRLHNIRKDKRVSQSQLAEELGITAGYISNIENFRTSLSLNYVQKFSEYFNIDIEQLFEESLEIYEFSQIDYEIMDMTDHFLKAATYNDKQFFEKILKLLITSSEKEKGVYNELANHSEKETINIAEI